MKKELQANIADEHRCQNAQQNTSQPNPTIHKKIIHYDQVGFIARMHG